MKRFERWGFVLLLTGATVWAWHAAGWWVIIPASMAAGLIAALGVMDDP